METIIVTTPEQLQSMIQAAVRSEVHEIVRALKPFRASETYTVSAASKLCGMGFRRFKSLVDQGHIKLTADGRVTRQVLEDFYCSDANIHSG